ncbi:MAG: hypothetical protein IIZ35_03900 [Clostridia bacterium]|nr:hypothetical protein [Clostridia bacterium]
MELKDIVEIVLKWVIPFILSTAASGAIGYARAMKKKSEKRDEEQKKTMEALKNGVQCLLRSEIIRANEKYTAQGYCPVYAKDALKVAYAAYHALGGNDVATKLFNDCIDLPEKPN